MTSSPVIAIGWQLWHRNRTGVTASAIVLALLTMFMPAMIALSRTVRAAGMADAAEFAESAAKVVPAPPLFLIFAFAMNALLFTEEHGNIASGYARRMYALPVRTATLALCPMGYAAAVVALLWYATALIYRTTGTHLPVSMPAAGLAAAMLTLQAVAWSPIGYSWARVALCAVAVPVVATPQLLLTALEVSSRWVAALVLGEIVLIAAVAVLAVGRDRRGEVWRFPVSRPGSRPRLSRHRVFRSTAAAQVWYEWRCHGLIVPVATAAAAVLILFVGLIGQVQTSGVAMGFFAVLLGLPLLLSGSLGGVAAQMQPCWVRKRSQFAFVVSKPITSGELVRAKFRMTARVALVTAGIAAASLLIAAAIRPAEAITAWRSFAASVPGGALTMMLIAVLYPLLLWRQATDLLVGGLAGRRWLSNLVEYSFSALFFVGGTAGYLVFAYPSLRSPALASLPWLVACAAVAKGLLAAWAYRQAVARQLMTRRFALAAVIGWVMTAACVAAAVWTLVPPDGLVVGRAVVALGAISAIPLARFPLAPLALDWNRHR